MIALVQASVLPPAIFMAQEPQTPSRQERRKVSVGSISFLILMSASSTIGPQVEIDRVGIDARVAAIVGIVAVDVEFLGALGLLAVGGCRLGQVLPFFGLLPLGKVKLNHSGRAESGKCWIVLSKVGPAPQCVPSAELLPV